MIDRLETADALRLGGVDPKSFRNTIDRGFYTEAPKTQQGKSRLFARDDVVCLAIFSTLSDLGVETSKAAKLASDTRAWMRKDPEVKTLFIVRIETAMGPRAEVVDALAPGVSALFTLQISKWRAAWSAKIRELIAERDGET